ncbi:MAG: hypothetical protein RL671_1025 [Pseudomonadota bacterium]|jgi:hypothetical protein
MGPIDWAGVALSALAAFAVLALAFRNAPGVRRTGWIVTGVLLSIIPAAMLGHALARIGPEKLAVKPQLFFMQSAGLALAFVIPALWLTQLRDGAPRRQAVIDSLAFLAAYLAMGTVFWLRA